MDSLRAATGDMRIDIERMRSVLIGFKTARIKTPEDRWLAQRASHLLVILDILTTNSASERHNKIRQLPVEITRSPSTKGPAGTVATFVVNDKTQLEVFTPTPATSASPHVPETGRPSGPSAPPVTDDCYDGPGPCVTQEEMDDIGIAIAYAQADLDTGWSDYYAGCDYDPEDCAFAPEIDFASGPSDRDGAGCAKGPCTQEAGNAVAALVGAAGSLALTILSYEAAVMSGLTLTATGAAALLAGAFSIGFVAGYYVGVWLACALPAVMPSPVAEAVAASSFEAITRFGGWQRMQ
jgi:hypothetical protein